jgi:hypothetical protein
MKGDAGRFLGLEKRQDAVLDVMKKQKIAADPGKLKNYRKKEFLKAVDKADIGFYAKKALHEVYGERKTAVTSSKIGAADAISARHKTYDEIMNKSKNSLQNKLAAEKLEQQSPKMLYFGTSSKNVRAASSLLGAASREALGHSEQHRLQTADEKNSEVKDVLKRIQN